MLLKRAIGRTRIEKVDQPALYLHVGIFLPGRKLDDETFRLVSVKGEESVSNPFEFELTLHANSRNPRRHPLKFSEIIGRRVTFAIQRPYTHDSELDRDTSYSRFREALDGKDVPGLSLFNGIVASFGMNEPGVYRLTMRPAIWKLSLTNRYRVYPQMSVKEAIAEVLGKNISASVDKLQDLALTRKQDWFQAGETDFEFLQRLMRKAHIYYYFEHGATDHTIVFKNSVDYPEIEFGDRALRYTHTSLNELGLDQDNVIEEYGYEQKLTHSSVEGAFTRQQDAWETAEVATYHTYHAHVGAASGELPFRLYKIMQYGGSDALARDYTKATAAAIRTAASQFSGTSRCVMLRVGYKFRAISDVDDLNHPTVVRPTLDGSWFALTHVTHEATLDGGYQNQFVAADADGLVAEVSPQDTQLGTVLAKVVAGDSSGVAPSNWRYYEKNNFGPTTSNATDAQSDPFVTSLQGVYVRFSCDPESTPPVWVKLASHMQSCPEIGALVTVTRANDESELPEIQNIVQANGQSTVVPDGHWTADTRVGNTYSTGYGDSQSVHFGRDSNANLTKAVGIVKQQYDTGNFRDSSYAQGARYSYETSENGRHRILSKSDAFGSTYSRSEAARRKSYEDVGKMFSRQKIGSSFSISDTTGLSYSKASVGTSINYHTVEGESKSYETFKGKRYSESTSKSDVENRSTVDGKSDSYETFTGKRYSESTSKGDVENHSRVEGKSDTYETFVGKRYSDSTSEGDVENHSTINGKSDSYETVKGDRYNKSRVEGLSVSETEVPGVERNYRRIGVANSNSAIGLNNDNSIIGFSEGTHVIGSSTDFRAAINVNTVNATAALSDINFTGVLLKVDVKGAFAIFENKGTNLRARTKPTGVELEMTGMNLKVTQGDIVV